MSQTKPIPPNASTDPPAEGAANRPDRPRTAAEWLRRDQERRIKERKRARKAADELADRGLKSVTVTIPASAVDSVQRLCNGLRQAHEQARRAREAEARRRSPREAQIDALVTSFVRQAIEAQPPADPSRPHTAPPAVAPGTNAAPDLGHGDDRDSVMDLDEIDDPDTLGTDP